MVGTPTTGFFENTYVVAEIDNNGRGQGLCGWSKFSATPGAPVDLEVVKNFDNDVP